MIAPCSIRRPDPVLLRGKQVLHIGLRSICTRERREELGDAACRQPLQLLRVEKILVGMAAAEEQHGRTEGGALRLARSALLEEAAERRKSGARADHDDRHR